MALKSLPQMNHPGLVFPQTVRRHTSVGSNLRLCLSFKIKTYFHLKDAGAQVLVVVWLSPKCALGWKRVLSAGSVLLSP